MSGAPWPVELRYSRTERTLTVTFEGGTTYALPAEYLRIDSPSAEVQGHGAATKTLVAGKKNVGIERIEPVGRYAVRLIFDDGHDTGLYSWDYLAQLGRERAKRWFEYEQKLKAARLSRES